MEIQSRGIDKAKYRYAAIKDRNMLSPHRSSARYPDRILMQMLQSDRLSYSYTINHLCAVAGHLHDGQRFLVSPIFRGKLRY